MRILDPFLQRATAKSTYFENAIKILKDLRWLYDIEGAAEKVEVKMAKVF